jgi:hypothetical protein
MRISIACLLCEPDAVYISVGWSLVGNITVPAKKFVWLSDEVAGGLVDEFIISARKVDDVLLGEKRCKTEGDAN